MWTRSRHVIFVLLVGSSLAGCGGVTVHQTATPVQVSGTVTSLGKPVNNVILRFQPTGDGLPKGIPVQNGKYEVSLVPGRYTYFVLAVEKKEKLLDAIPVKYHEGSLDREISFTSSSTHNLQLD